jgi:DNA polymerase IV (DinB-like DNA polymerase)
MQRYRAMRIILHIDMDSFFASVEAREHPEFAGKPIIVGADPKEGKGRGVVSTCSYEARVFGVRSGMPISEAYRRCPEGIYLPVNYRLYSEVSRRIMEILRGHADAFEQVSIDEAFLDLSSIGSYDAVRVRALHIQMEIGEKEGLSCSLGIGPNKLIAKIASDFHKPGGITVVRPEEVRAFLSPLPVRTIPGIGKKTGEELQQMGISTIGELSETDVQELIARFGRWGLSMYRFAHGQDEREVVEEREPRSISREVTFGEDTADPLLLSQGMAGLAADLHQTLTRKHFLFRTITIKVREAGFITHTRARSLDHATDDPGVIERVSLALLQEFLDGRKIRLIGLRLSGFEQVGSGQRSLFEWQEGE